MQKTTSAFSSYLKFRAMHLLVDRCTLKRPNNEANTKRPYPLCLHALSSQLHTPFRAFPSGADSWHWQGLIVGLHGDNVKDDLLAIHHLTVLKLLLHHQLWQGADALCEI